MGKWGGSGGEGGAMVCGDAITIVFAVYAMLVFLAGGIVLCSAISLDVHSGVWLCAALVPRNILYRYNLDTPRGGQGRFCFSYLSSLEVMRGQV